MLTVEEARERVIREIYALYDEDISVVDILILAVQAAMPCRYWAWRQDCPERYFEHEIAKWCPSCSARRNLAEMEVPA